MVRTSPDAFATAWEWHVKQKRHVIPVGNGDQGKDPMDGWKNFQTEQPTDEQLLTWESELHPPAWGCVCGAVPGIIMIGPDSAEANRLFTDLSLEPHIKSPRGWHYYFKHPGFKIPTVRDIVPSVDVRGDGGQAIFCGSSVHGQYQVLRMPAPENLYSWEQVPEVIRKALVQHETTKRTGPAAPLPEKLDKGARNSMLASLAGSMRRRNASQETIEGALLSENAVKCDPPLPDKDVHTIAKSISKYTPAPTQENEDIRLTDVGNAQRLVAAHGKELRYCYSFHSWLCWNGQRWLSDAMGEVERRAKSVIQDMLTQAASMLTEAARLKATGEGSDGDRLAAQAEALWKHATRSEQAPRIAAMISLAQSEAGIPIAPEDLDRDPWLLNCLNGTINLHTGQLRTHDPRDLLTKMAPVNFDAQATLPLWDKFLEDAVPDLDTLAYVQRCAGATVVGKADDDLLLVCHGQAGTGKGTFLNSLRAALGDYAAVSDLETFTTKKDPHAPQPDLAALRGKRMVAISEVDTGGAVALLKRATGGDPIRTRSHHQESFEFVPQFTLWIICNDRPRVPDDDTGVWRRMREIPFVTKFASPDPSIRPTLTDPAIAGPAILAWAVLGCLMWQREGVGKLPQQIANATADYRADMDPLNMYVADCCIQKPDIETLGAPLWAAYQNWLQANGIRRGLGRKRWGQRMAARFTAKHTNSGTAFVGVVLRDKPIVTLGLQAQSDTSQLSLKAKVPVDYYNHSSWGKNTEQSVTKCHSSFELASSPKCHSMPEPNVTKVSPEVSLDATHKSDSQKPDAPDKNPDGDFDALGMSVAEVLALWQAEGRPMIHLAPGENCEDLGELLSGAEVKQEHLDAVRAWLLEVRANGVLAAGPRAAP